MSAIPENDEGRKVSWLGSPIQHPLEPPWLGKEGALKPARAWWSPSNAASSVAGGKLLCDDCRSARDDDDNDDDDNDDTEDTNPYAVCWTWVADLGSEQSDPKKFSPGFKNPILEKLLEFGVKKETLYSA